MTHFVYGICNFKNLGAAKIMTTVYVLINCNIGSEVWVIGELKKIDCVKEIQGIFGLFDVLVKVKHLK